MNTDTNGNGRPRKLHPAERKHEIPNAAGELLLMHLVYRMTDGSKICPYQSRRQVGWVWHPSKTHCPQADDLLYGLPAFLEVKESAEVVYWTEGEKDADTAVAKAGVVAVAHHQGAVHSTLGQARWFEGYQGTVIVVADVDIAGAADALRRYRLLARVGIPRERLRIVRPAEPYGLDGKDLTDHFDAGWSIDDLVEVNNRINEVASLYIVNGGPRFGSGHD